jgi:hypothetical protein
MHINLHKNIWMKSNSFIFDVFLYIFMYFLTFYKSIYFPLNVTQRVSILHKQLYIETPCMNN